VLKNIIGSNYFCGSLKGKKLIVMGNDSGNLFHQESSW